MLYIGSHTSIAGGLEHAAIEAKALGATAFGMFTKNQRQWASRPITEEESSKFKETLKDLGFSKDQVLPHDSYLINLGNPDDQKRRQSLELVESHNPAKFFEGLMKGSFTSQVIPCSKDVAGIDADSQPMILLSH